MRQLGAGVQDDLLLAEGIVTISSSLSDRTDFTGLREPSGYAGTFGIDFNKNIICNTLAVAGTDRRYDHIGSAGCAD